VHAVLLMLILYSFTNVLKPLSLNTNSNNNNNITYPLSLNSIEMPKLPLSQLWKDIESKKGIFGIFQREYEWEIHFSYPNLTFLMDLEGKEHLEKQAVFYLYIYIFISFISMQVSCFLNEERAQKRCSPLHRHSLYKTTPHLCVQIIVTENPGLLPHQMSL
jgi:hypothetical protein